MIFFFRLFLSRRYVDEYSSYVIVHHFKWFRFVLELKQLAWAFTSTIVNLCHPIIHFVYWFPQIIGSNLCWRNGCEKNPTNRISTAPIFEWNSIEHSTQSRCVWWFVVSTWKKNALGLTPFIVKIMAKECELCGPSLCWIFDVTNQANAKSKAILRTIFIIDISQWSWSQITFQTVVTKQQRKNDCVFANTPSQCQLSKSIVTTCNSPFVALHPINSLF